MALNNRHLKIFISSTFQDMKEERETLLKDIFFELRSIAKKRDVEITEIDLRWGIGEEEASSGKTVKICLDEIERCKDSPIFFIGILGSRYGWSDWYNSIDKAILDDKKYSWIKNHTDKSITELEIISALENNTQNNKAFIYLKERTDDANEKLVDLKDRLEEFSKNSDSLYLDNYRNKEDFKIKVKESLINTLDELFPENEKLSEVERLRQSHQIFAKSRQKVYIQHKDNEDILSNFISSDKDRLLLYGDSGLGKSALISNYFDKFKEKHNDYFIIEHYIGGAGELSNDLYHILNRVMLEIKDRFDIDDEIPTEPQKIIDEFRTWLDKVSSPTIIILDGYNQIEDDMKEKLFYYLPDKLSNVQLIITSIKDNYPIENKSKIEHLDKTEKEKLIINYLNIYGKNIGNNVIEKIVSHQQTDNTLFLKTILDEVRLIGSNDYLYTQIDKYLESKDIVELFDKIFQRFENDYEEQYPNLTQQILSLLYVSRDGLSETNLIEIIDIERLYFSPLFLALEEHFINKNGLYGFFHDYIKEAVKNRYLKDEENIKDYRRKIAEYFEKKEIDNQKIRELPYQLYILEDNSLSECFLDIKFFIKSIDLYPRMEYEFIIYYKFINNINQTSTKLLDKLLKNNNIYDVSRIAIFLMTCGFKYKESLLLFEKVLNMQKNIFGNNHIKTSQSYRNLANIYHAMGNYSKSIKLLNKTLKIRKKFLNKDDVDILSTYTDLAHSLRMEGLDSKSLKITQNTLKHSLLKLGESHPISRELYNNLGVLYQDLGNYDEALSIHYKILKLDRIFGDTSLIVGGSYINIALVYFGMEYYKKSLFYLRKSINLYKNIFSKKSTETLNIYFNLAKVYLKTNHKKRAMILYSFCKKNYENIFEDGHPLLISINEEIGDIYFEEFHFDKAKLSYINVIEISSKLHLKNSETASYYNKLAFCYEQTNKYTESFYHYKRSLKIYKDTFGDMDINVAILYLNIGRLLFTINKYRFSSLFLKKSIDIQKKLNRDELSLLPYYNMLGIVLFNLKNYEEAFFYYNKTLTIAKKFEKQHVDFIGVSYNNIAKLLVAKKDYSDVDKLYKKAIDIEIVINNQDKSGLIKYYSNYADYLVEVERKQEARGYYLSSKKLLEMQFDNHHPEIISIKEKMGNL